MIAASLILLGAGKSVNSAQALLLEKLHTVFGVQTAEGSLARPGGALGMTRSNESCPDTFRLRG